MYLGMAIFTAVFDLGINLRVHPLQSREVDLTGVRSEVKLSELALISYLHATDNLHTYHVNILMQPMQ